MTDIVTNEEIEPQLTQEFVQQVKEILPFEEENSSKFLYQETAGLVFYPDKQNWDREMLYVPDHIGYFKLLGELSKKYDLNDREQAAKALDEAKVFLKAAGIDLIVIEPRKDDEEKVEVTFNDNSNVLVDNLIDTVDTFGGHYGEDSRGLQVSDLKDQRGLNPETVITYTRSDIVTNHPPILFVNKNIHPQTALAVVAHELGHEMERKDTRELEMADGDMINVHPSTEVLPTLYALKAANILYSATKYSKLPEYGAIQASKYNHVLGKKE